MAINQQRTWGYEAPLWYQFILKIDIEASKWSVDTREDALELVKSPRTKSCSLSERYGQVQVVWIQIEQEDCVSFRKGQ